jgi:hypothetical protein
MQLVLLMGGGDHAVARGKISKKWTAGAAHYLLK